MKLTLKKSIGVSNYDRRRTRTCFPTGFSITDPRALTSSSMVSCVIDVILQGCSLQSYFLADNKSDAIYQVSNIYTTSSAFYFHLPTSRSFHHSSSNTINILSIATIHFLIPDQSPYTLSFLYYRSFQSIGLQRNLEKEY